MEITKQIEFVQSKILILTFLQLLLLAGGTFLIGLGILMYFLNNVPVSWLLRWDGLYCAQQYIYNEHQLQLKFELLMSFSIS